VKLALAPVILAAPLVAACAGYNPDATTTVTGPAFGADGADFRPISAVVERRCGTLDCHGQTGRPLRIYGQYGLRSPAGDGDAGGYYPGGLDPTTVVELTSNFQSMCGLEPEKLNLVVAGRAAPDTLTLVRKPRLAEKHKGGLVWNQGDDGDVCLVNWLTGVADTSACATELMHP
jgi:hypothetical protein